MYDVIIVGGGPAGVAAAIYEARAGLDALIIEKMNVGGQAALTEKIENYPGFEMIQGFEFAMKLRQHVTAQGVPIVQETVIGIEDHKDTKKIKTNKNVYECRSIILANGLKRRKLGCPGESELAGRGVSYCATCDGAFYRGKDVCLVGGGNTALADALFLANHCNHVSIVHRRDEFRASKSNRDAIAARENITCYMNAIVTRIEGEKAVQSVKIESVDGNKPDENLSVNGVFVAVGYEPDNEFVRGIVDLNDKGYYVTNENLETNVPGIYVAGDCREKELRQIITAEADGAIAAIQAANYVNML